MTDVCDTTMKLHMLWCRSMGWPSVESLAGAVMLLHIVVCPFTKVEESFNIQATHDILYHGIHIKQYDHLEFPGVVPRTFLGPLVLAMTTAPAVYLCQFLNVSKFISQYIVRTALGLYVLAALSVFGNAIKYRFGPDLKRWMFLITATQFHFMFYMSRPLPNTFALILVLLALAAWIKQNHGQFLWISGAAIIIFRSELAVYLGLILAAEVFSKRLTITALLKHVIPAGIILIGLTVVVDSFFWRRWLWPEGEVLWFNTIENQSSKWGTEPFAWYFTSALPRALSMSAFLVPMGIILNPHLRPLLVPAIGYVLLYSNLPHKELRFIIYVVPIFNVVAAAGVSKIWANRSKSCFKRLVALVAVAHILGNIMSTTIFLFVSHQNYPGGQAMQKFHQLEKPYRAVYLHIDVPAAQTGVTRFTQINPKWKYDKTENLMPGSQEMLEFSHIFVGNDDILQFYQATHSVIAKIDSYDRLRVDVRSFPPITVKTKPNIWILKRNLHVKSS
ncbi:dol-P-Man:Man(7)GlcNAc(2)-PP-Dol alpha-1,6-mannosyltransferase-like isoform X2 [Ostrea edulis]|uniref:dol-P-Man:Man(7)GlcNAc(2)-PP-Dol alpha-1,6-mannosyltransferase-like isoform X2 n=1 Tax=Ostrea edulis TaxID=37623 RepID=UPI0024AF01F3|nr:dol-P-Man:Man(7)GlcNAc(2)-PP-Dol alpha-1,6-mannosyltransferase-like isoform X2 [Ostrea edulis]